VLGAKGDRICRLAVEVLVATSEPPLIPILAYAPNAATRKRPSAQITHHGGSRMTPHAHLGLAAWFLMRRDWHLLAYVAAMVVLIAMLVTK
jgi:hypothetical protein